MKRISAMVLTALLLSAALWGLPSVSISNPAGTKVGGVVTVKVTTVNTVKVVYYKNSTLVGTTTTAPFSMNFNFNGDTPGVNIMIKAIAYDSSGKCVTNAKTVHKPTVCNQ